MSLTETLTLTLEDVGSRIRAKYTPIRADGVQGDEVTATTDVVVEGMRAICLRKKIYKGLLSFSCVPQISNVS